ncbi:hypothetical protein RHMOL_Rhmol08G0191800 [Rhododendron molle]|uniref:Uncharacterized protein n=1 Tax=Rhododendron molle TaxID=49168 RepID=A0ACC0MS26_RHOML|nr:hypothetical protein RHMOL_Rhmol08G0191800 [Rhododendron molle]
MPFGFDLGAWFRSKTVYHTEQVHNKVLTLLAIMLEFGALIWYSLSYIPFARSMVSKVVVACFDTEF